MDHHRKEIINRIKEFSQESLYLSDTHIFMCKYCNVRLEDQKKDALTKHTTSASHLKEKNIVYLIIVGSKNSDLYFLFLFANKCEIFIFYFFVFVKFPFLFRKLHISMDI
jgi:hypothetical protein